MSFRPVISSNSYGQNLNEINGIMRTIQNEQRVKIFKDDVGMRRVLLGKGKDGFYGMKVSPDGTDVTTAADDELIFNSNQNVFKVLRTGVVTATKPADEHVWFTDVELDLDNNPALLAFIELDYGNGIVYEPLPNIRINISTGVVTLQVKAYVKNTQLRVEIDATQTESFYAQSLSYDIRYFLLQESAA